MDNKVRMLSVNGATTRDVEIASDVFAKEIRAAVVRASESGVPAGIIYSTLAIENHTILHAMVALQ